MEGSLDAVAQAHCGLSLEQGDDTAITLSAGMLRAALAAARADGIGFCQSTTAQEKRDSMYFRQLLDSLPDFVYFKDLNSRFLCINQAHAAWIGLSDPEEAIGKSDFDFFLPDDAEGKFSDEQEIIRTGRGFAPRVERDYQKGGEFWALSTKHPLRDSEGNICGTFGLSRDVTAEYQAKKDLAEQHRLLETLINVLPCRIFVRDREHRFQLINEEYKRSIQLGDATPIIGRRINEYVQDVRADRIHEEDEYIMQSGQSVLRRVEFDTSPLEHGRWLSVSKVPLRTLGGSIEGLVGVAFDITAQKEAEARAREISEQLRERNEQIESELALARKLQTTLATFGFPEHIHLTGQPPVQAAYLYEASEHVAGDFFQIFQIDECRFGAFICDVMGHGVRSALVTAVIRGLIEEKRPGLVRPAAFFGELNRVLYRMGEDPSFPRFVTAEFVLFDVCERRVEIVSAGHPPVLAIERRDGFQSIGLTQERDPALGLVEDYSFRTTTCPLDDYTLFLLYTDGLTEERNAEGQEFGEAGLADCLESLKGPCAKELMGILRERLKRHAGQDHFSDDICAVAIGFEGVGD